MGELFTGLSTLRLQAGTGAELDLKKPLSHAELGPSLQPTEKVDIFFSHVWSASPSARYVGILWCLNGRRSVITAFIITMIIAFGLSFIDSRSWVSFERSSGLTAQSVLAVICTVLTLIFFWSYDVIIYPLRFLKFIYRGSRLCFFDRCCIDQDNAEEKARGIRDIPRILENSDKLVVLLSDHYFDRLWCCYELAVFRSLLHDSQRIVMVPLRFVVLTILMTLFDMLSAFLFRSNIRSLVSRESNDTFITVSVVFGVLMALLGYAFSLTWARDIHRLKERVSNFTLDSVSCTDDADRVVLVADIERRFNGTENFEETVRSELMKDIGTRPRFKYSVFISVPTLASLLGYLSVVTQRMSLICMTELGTKDFIQRDDSTCVVLDRPLWMNIFVVVSEFISEICYYPVMIGSVLWFNKLVHRATLRWTRYALHLVGISLIAVGVIAEHIQYEDVVVAQAIKSGSLAFVASLLYLVPLLQQRMKNKTSKNHIFMDKTTKTE